MFNEALFLFQIDPIKLLTSFRSLLKVDLSYEVLVEKVAAKFTKKKFQLKFRN